MRISDAITAFLADRARRCKPHTAAWYGSFLRLLCAWCEQRQIVTLCQLTPTVLADYVEHMKRRPLQNHRQGGLSPVTVNKSAKALRTFLLFLERDGHLTVKLSQTLPIPNAGRRVPKALPLSQARRLLTAPMSARDRAAICLMLDAGPRAAEVVGLDLTDVDLRERTMLIRHGKGDKARMVVFGAEAAAELQAWLDVRPLALSPALFTTKDGRRMSPDALYHAVKNAAAAVGLDCRPHILRHTFATCALDGDAPLTDIQQILGHEHVSTTMVYLSVSRSGLRRRHATYSPLRRIRNGG